MKTKKTSKSIFFALIPVVFLCVVVMGVYALNAKTTAAGVIIPQSIVSKNDSLRKIENKLIQQKQSLYLIDSVLIEKTEKAGFEESMKINSKVRRNQFTQDSIGWQLDTLRMKHIALFQPLMKKSK